MGRKDRYKTHVEPYLKQIGEWYQLLTEEQIAKKLGISPRTFDTYKTKHPELVEVLRSGRETLIEDLKGNLKKKAAGYFYEETKTSIREFDGKTIKTIEKYKKYAHPDVGAIHLLLKNLDETWRNDDAETMKIKKEQVKIAKEKAENAAW